MIRLDAGPTGKGLVSTQAGPSLEWLVWKWSNGIRAPVFICDLARPRRDATRGSTSCGRRPQAEARGTAAEPRLTSTRRGVRENGTEGDASPDPRLLVAADCLRSHKGAFCAQMLN